MEEKIMQWIYMLAGFSVGIMVTCFIIFILAAKEAIKKEKKEREKDD